MPKSFRNLCVVNRVQTVENNNINNVVRYAIKTSLLTKYKNTQPKTKKRKNAPQVHFSLSCCFSQIRLTARSFVSTFPSCVFPYNMYVMYPMYAFFFSSNLCVFVEGRIYCLSFYLGYRSMSFSTSDVCVYKVVAFFFLLLLTPLRLLSSTRRWLVSFWVGFATFLFILTHSQAAATAENTGPTRNTSQSFFSLLFLSRLWRHQIFKKFCSFVMSRHKWAFFSLSLARLLSLSLAFVSASIGVHSFYLIWIVNYECDLYTFFFSFFFALDFFTRACTADRHNTHTLQRCASTNLTFDYVRFFFRHNFSCWFAIDRVVHARLQWRKNYQPRSRLVIRSESRFFFSFLHFTSISLILSVSLRLCASARPKT